MSIKFKLGLSLGLLAAALLALSIGAFITLQKTTATTEAIVDDGVKGLGDLTRINDMYSNIVRDVQGVALGELSFEEGAASLKESLGNIETDWTDYLASHVVPEAEPIVVVAKQRMEEAKANIDELGRLLAGQDLGALNVYVKQTLGDTMESIASQFDQLAEIQIGVAQTDDEGAKALSSAASIGLAAVAAISAGILAYALFVVMLGVMRPLNGMEKSMRTLAGGDTGTTIPYLTRRDEIGRMAAAVEVRRLAQSAASASSEVKALIEQSAREVKSGSLLVSDAAAKLDTVVASIRSNSETMGEIARASRAQASAIEEVRTAVRVMDEMTQHNAALVEETNAAIEQTEEQARRLDQVVNGFILAPATGQAATPSRRLAVVGNTALDPAWEEL